MGRFVEGADRSQLCLLPGCLDDWVHEDNPVHVVEAFVEALDLAALGFAGVTPAATGCPAYHPAVLLKLYIYGYLNRVQSSRRLERGAGRNVELMWLLGRLVPDHKTISDFRKDRPGCKRRSRSRPCHVQPRWPCCTSARATCGHVSSCSAIRSWRAPSGTSGSRWMIPSFFPSKSTSEPTTAAPRRHEPHARGNVGGRAVGYTSPI